MSSKPLQTSVPQKSSNKVETISIATRYLLTYNAAQFIGWGVILIRSLIHIIKNNSSAGLYDDIGWVLNLYQCLALAEVAHIGLGFVRSNIMLTGLQVASRVFLVWVIYTVPQVHDCLGVAILTFAWSITEVVRYSFYALGLLNSTPYFLTWCRYTFFIVLYPLGVTGELMTIYASLDYVSSSGMFSYRLPNALNFGFDYHIALYLIMASYLPGFPSLYGHMLSQRRKIIGGSATKQKTK